MISALSRGLIRKDNNAIYSVLTRCNNDLFKKLLIISILINTNNVSLAKLIFDEENPKSIIKSLIDQTKKEKTYNYLYRICLRKENNNEFLIDNDDLETKYIKIKTLLLKNNQEFIFNYYSIRYGFDIKSLASFIDNDPYLFVSLPILKQTNIIFEKDNSIPEFKKLYSWPKWVYTPKLDDLRLKNANVKETFHLKYDLKPKKISKNLFYDNTLGKYLIRNLSFENIDKIIIADQIKFILNDNSIIPCYIETMFNGDNYELLYKKVDNSNINKLFKWLINSDIDSELDYFNKNNNKIEKFRIKKVILRQWKNKISLSNLPFGIKNFLINRLNKFI